MFCLLSLLGQLFGHVCLVARITRAGEQARFRSNAGRPERGRVSLRGRLGEQARGLAQRSATIPCPLREDNPYRLMRVEPMNPIEVSSILSRRPPGVPWPSPERFWPRVFSYLTGATSNRAKACDCRAEVGSNHVFSARPHHPRCRRQTHRKCSCQNSQHYGSVPRPSLGCPLYMPEAGPHVENHVGQIREILNFFLSDSPLFWQFGGGHIGIND